MLSMYGYEYEMKMDASLWKAESILGGNKKWHFYRPRAKLCTLYTFGQREENQYVLHGVSFWHISFQRYL